MEDRLLGLVAAFAAGAALGLALSPKARRGAEAAREQGDRGTDAPATRAADADRLSAAWDEMSALRGRLAQAESALRNARAKPGGESTFAPKIATAEVEATEASKSDGETRRLEAAFDEIASLRERLGQAEAGLREMRRRPPEPSIAAAPADSDRLRSALDELQSLRRRLSQAETGLRGLRAGRLA